MKGGIAHQWTILAAAVDFLAAAVIEFVVEIRTAVFAPAIGTQLQKLWAFTTAGFIDPRLRQRQHVFNVVAIAAVCGNAVALRDAMKRSRWLSFIQPGVDGKLIVLADEQDR